MSGTTNPSIPGFNASDLLRPPADILRDLADVHLRLSTARLALKQISEQAGDLDARELAASAYRNTDPARAAVHHHYPPTPKV